jgi:ABC-type dipeptide/oligopeptide/nickel transport system permease subunit
MKAFPIKLKLSLAILLIILLLTILGPLLGGNPNFINPDQPTVLPSLTHLFGTDELGRDLLSRLAIGAQVSLLIGLSTAVVASLIGTAYGTIAAYFENTRLDELMMGIIDVIYSLPGLMIVILFTIFLGRNVQSLILALALFSWPDTARIIRGQVLSLKREEFVESYYSLGGGALPLVFSHFIPNMTALIILTTTITVPRAILTESTLSFVGLGVAPPFSSWGTMISDGWQMIRIAPHLVLLPGLFLFMTMAALNLLGESLKEMLHSR